MADESDKLIGTSGTSGTSETQGGEPTPPQTPATPPESPANRGQAADKEERRFTQADLDRLIDERLKREREKSAKAAEKAKADAEAKALEEGNQFKELADKRAAKIAELEAQASEMETVRTRQADYEKAITGYLMTEKNGLSEPILALLEKLDPLDQLAWIAENKAKLLPANNGKAQHSPVPATPAPDNGKSLSDAERERRRKEFGAQIGTYF